MHRILPWRSPKSLCTQELARPLCVSPLEKPGHCSFPRAPKMSLMDKMAWNYLGGCGKSIQEFSSGQALILSPACSFCSCVTVGISGTSQEVYRCWGSKGLVGCGCSLVCTEKKQENGCDAAEDQTCSKGLLLSSTGSLSFPFHCFFSFIQC